MSGETLRRLVEDEGKAVFQAFATGTPPITWTAKDCPAEVKTAGSPTRVYFGCDGVMAAEKATRREKVKAKRRRCGKRRRPLRRAKAGADRKYEEFKLVTYYDEDVRHRLVLGTRGNRDEAGRLMRRLAARIDMGSAAEKVDGAPWIANQVTRRGLPLDALGLDFYHLAENVHAGRRATFEETALAGML